MLVDIVILIIAIMCLVMGGFIVEDDSILGIISVIVGVILGLMVVILPQPRVIERDTIWEYQTKITTVDGVSDTIYIYNPK